MSGFRTIEIDFQVHKRIELERRNFDETPNAVIRRLLNINDDQSAVSRDLPNRESAWAGKGVTLPGGTELRMEYNGRVHAGVIRNGKWQVEGAEYNSRSGAAKGVARTKDGTRASLDGWEYWNIKRPGDPKWMPISHLRATTRLR